MIKMIAGVFGLPVNGVVKAMDKNSGAFSAGEEQEARLVRLGMAEYVTSAPVVDAQNASAYDGAPIGFDETPPEDDGEPELPDGVVGIPEYSTKNTKAELMEIGALCGISLDADMTKAQMVVALDAHIEANMVDGVDIDAAEDDGEPAPTFDAAEAVL